MLQPQDINEILKGYIESAIWTEEEQLRSDYESQYGSGEDEYEDDNELDKLVRLSANIKHKQFESFTR